MAQLYEERRGLDLVSLAEKTKDHAAVNSAGGSAYLAELTTAVHTAADI